MVGERDLGEYRIFYAHSLGGGEKRRWQPLAEHLRAVAEQAGARGAKFGARNAASLAGLMHDLGKYSLAFQRRLEGAGEKVDHSTAGAQQIVRSVADPDARIIAKVIAHAIAGHHAGLPDTIGDEREPQRSAQAGGRSARFRLGLARFRLWSANLMPAIDWGDGKSLAYRLAFFGRMIFSCLVDADFRDTEAFYAAAEGRSVDRDWSRLSDVVDALISRFDAFMAKTMASAKPTPVNALRAEILRHVRGRAGESRGCSRLRSRLEAARPSRRWPSLSITPSAMISIGSCMRSRSPRSSIRPLRSSARFWATGSSSSITPRSTKSHIEGREARDKLRLAMEDWAAPVVVTTNVQLFESLHSNRPSRCRRLHSLARSVIVLDEAQTIPLPLLRPCLAAIDELARNYGASVILCTATQPAVAKPQFEGGLALGPERELAPDPMRLHRELKRVRVVHIGEKTDTDLVEALAAAPQGLVVVNSRAHALSLFRSAVAAESRWHGASHNAAICRSPARNSRRGAAPPKRGRIPAASSQRPWSKPASISIFRSSGGPRPGSTRSRRRRGDAIARASGRLKRASLASSGRRSISLRARSPSLPATWPRRAQARGYPLAGRHAGLFRRGLLAQRSGARPQEHSHGLCNECGRAELRIP